MTKIRFYIIEDPETIERLYIKRYSVDHGLQLSSDPDGGATFTHERDGFHRANVFHGIMSHILKPIPVLIELTEE